MAAMNKPASSPANNPTHGLALPIPNLTSAAYVTAAAVKAPANILPSSAMLITPDRSENSPPNAARTRGVASLIVDSTTVSNDVKKSLIGLRPQTSESKPVQRPFEKSFSSDEENDDSLQDLHD